MLLGCSCCLLLGGSCTANDPEVIVPKRYESAKELGADLTAGGFPCQPSATKGPIGKHEREVAVCGDDDAHLTIHILKGTGNAPENEPFAPPPIIYWVSGPGWFVATDSQSAAAAAKRILGGELTSSDP